MAKNAKNKKRRKSTVSVDFTGVEASSRSIEDGTYLATVTSVEEKESGDDQPYLLWKWQTKPKKGTGAVIFDNTSLQPQALWRLRLLLEAIGEEIIDGEMDLDPESYVGREAKLEITNEKYEGKNRPRITGFIALTDGEEGEESDDEEKDENDEEEEKSSKKKSKKSKDEDDDDDSDDDSDSDDSEDDDEEEEDEKPAKKSKKGKKSKDEEDDEEEDDSDDEEDDEEEDEKPSKKGKKSKFKVGLKVKFKDEKGKTVKGVIIKVNDDTAQVEDKDEEEWEVELDDLTVV